MKNLSEYGNVLDRLQVVVLDCPYNSFSSPTTQKLFGKFVNMKLTGFLREYEHGILPLGSYDFIGTLIMLCEKKDGELEPVFCFKSTNIERVKYFNLPFELLEWFHSAAEKNHETVVRGILEKAEKENINVGYNSSWTIDPKWREVAELKLLAKELSVALFVNYYQSRSIQEILIGGVKRFKVDQIQGFLGFEYLKYNGEVLPPIEAWFAKNEKAILMHLTRFSEDAQSIADQYSKLWNERIEILEDGITSEKIAA